MSHPAALTTSKYGISKTELLKACASREWLLMKRNSFVYIFKMMQLILVAFVTMTVFIRTEMHRDSVIDGGIFMGVLFYSLIKVMFNGFSDLVMAVAKLPVFYKQRDLLLYPSWAYSLPRWILNIPISVTEAAAWVSMTYYVIGFDPNVGRMFKQYLLLLLISQMASGLFLFMAALGRNMIVANTFGSFALLATMTLGGFIVSRECEQMVVLGLLDLALMYAQNSIAANEFLGHSWSHVLGNSTQSLGIQVLKSRGIFANSYWYWIGVGALLGYTCLFNAYEKGQAVLSKEALMDKHRNRTGDVEGLELSSRGKRSASTQSSGFTKTEDANMKKKKGMVLPFVPLSLAFDNIKYSIDMPPEMKKRGIQDDRLMLLKGVSGAFRPGVLTALMGVSGAGKTTLMDVLAGRKTSGYIEGNISISGYPKKQETFARISGYCEQNDIHSPHVTVYESLLYSAWFRLPSEVDSATRKMFIEEVMELVELTSLRESLVGLPGLNGLSTEQHARVAAIVMRTVRNTVDTGRTVVCTIHQPSIDIFESFDELFLIKRGGEEIYVGPLGHHSYHLIKYFEILGVKFADIYKNSNLYQRNKAVIKELSSPPPGSKDLYFPTQYSQSSITQCAACLRKQHMSYWRVSDRICSMQWAPCMLQYFSLEYEAAHLCNQSWPLNEQSSIGKGLLGCILPYHMLLHRLQSRFHVFLQTLIYGVIVYVMIAFESTASKFFWYLFFMFFTLLYFTYYGMMAVGLTPNQNISEIVSAAFYSIWNIFSGFLIPRPRIPVWWRWYSWA
ncbi:hypothetical protein MRB53_016901 [Persea americana]|uniref:Uncharacterized protein n=1 Tax=Persea americana TaxID=3435 RepID=A0ACC2M3F4_PERAE|nr:hypothetical protein MRB53_016901 [Persea americana]